MRKTYKLVVVFLTLAAFAVGTPASARFGLSGQASGTNAKVDVNIASEKDLETLPGVGAATAKKIIAGRPYSSVSDLSKAGVSAATIGKITPLVSIGNAPAAASASAPPASKGSNPPASKAAASSTAPAPAAGAAPSQTPAAPAAPAASTQSSSAAQGSPGN